MASSVFVDKKRLSIVSRAASARPGVVPVVAYGVSSTIWRRRSGGSSRPPPLSFPLLEPFSSGGSSSPLSGVTRYLLWRTDSTTALAYVRYEGGTLSLPLLLLAREVLLLAHSLRLRVRPVFVTTEESLRADTASRFQSLPVWRLPPAIFGAICHRWGCPVIVLFATTASTHLPRSSPGATLKRRKHLTLWLGGGVFLLAYAFPPPLLPRVLQTLAVSTIVFLLFSPHRPTQRWSRPFSVFR